MGNFKFDVQPSSIQLVQGRAWRQALGRPVVMLASAREGEEAMLAEILKQKEAQALVLTAQPATKTIAPAVQWLVVPRHPQRFDEVETLLRKASLSVARRSQCPPGRARDTTGRRLWAIPWVRWRCTTARVTWSCYGRFCRAGKPDRSRRFECPVVINSTLRKLAAALKRCGFPCRSRVQQARGKPIPTPPGARQAALDMALAHQGDGQDAGLLAG
jgi:hypothetical protein